MLIIKDLFVFLLPGGVDYAEEFQAGGSCVFNVLYRVRRDINGTIGAYLGRLVIYVHQAMAGDNVIDLGGFEFVRPGLVAGTDLCVGEAVADLQV